MSDVPHWADWLLVALVLLGVEALTLHFVLLFFGLGALAAAASSPFLGPVGQCIVFAVSSVLLVLLARPPLMAWTSRHRGAITNVDRVSGRSAIVTIAVDNHANTGQVRVGTEYWTARTPGDDDPPIDAGVLVRIESVAGVTALVVPRPATATGEGS